MVSGRKWDALVMTARSRGCPGWRSLVASSHFV